VVLYYLKTLSELKDNFTCILSVYIFYKVDSVASFSFGKINVNYCLQTYLKAFMEGLAEM
jgi:hypothetical protein